MSDDEPTFPKQRRNLVLISSLVLFYELGSISSNGAVHLPMIDATINETTVINAFLHAILIYFLWRYFTVFKTPHANRMIWSGSDSKIINCMYRHAQKNVLKKLRGKSRDDRTIGTKHNPIAIDKKTQNILVKGAEYIFTYDDVQSGRREDAPPVLICGIHLLIIKFVIYLDDFLFANIFLEYYFPFVIFLVALLESFDIGFGRHIVNLLNW